MNNTYRDLYAKTNKAVNGDYTTHELLGSNFCVETLRKNDLNFIISSASRDIKNLAEKYIKQNYIYTEERNVYLLTESETVINLQGYKKALWDKISFYNKANVSVEAVDLLCYSSTSLSSDKIIYQQGQNSLSFGELAKLAGIVLKFASPILGKDLSNYSKGLLALEGIEKLANGKSQLNMLDTIGYAGDVIAEFAKSYTTNSDVKNQISIASGVFGLAITFLKKRR